jgi:hypothetical protein
MHQASIEPHQTKQFNLFNRVLSVENVTDWIIDVTVTDNPRCVELLIIVREGRGVITYKYDILKTVPSVRFEFVYPLGYRVVDTRTNTKYYAVR